MRKWVIPLAPVAVGVALLVLALALLEPEVFDRAAHNGLRHTHHLAEAIKIALTVWKQRTGDPRFVIADPSALLDQTFVARLRAPPSFR